MFLTSESKIQKIKKILLEPKYLPPPLKFLFFHWYLTKITGHATFQQWPKSGMSPRKQPVSQKLIFLGGWVQRAVIAPSVVVIICPVEKIAVQNENKWLLAPNIKILCSNLHIFGPCDQWVQHNRGGLTKGTTFGQKTTMYAPNHKCGQIFTWKEFKFFRTFAIN